MSTFFKLFDVGSNQSTSHNKHALEKAQLKPKKFKQRNGIYRTVKVNKSTSNLNAKVSHDPASSDVVDNELLATFSSNNILDISKSAKNNSDIVFYKRKIPSHLDSDEEKVEQKYVGDSGVSEDEYDDASEDEYDGILVDVLPSFQFYDSLVKFLPDDNYEDLDNCDIEDNILLSPVAVGEENVIDETNIGFNPPEYETPLSSNVLSVSSRQFNETSVRYEVDNIHNLPQKTFEGLEINIVLTKTAVKPNTPLEKETILREFSSGEIINGYFTVTNRTQKPMRFEGFYVSFEGVTIIKNKDTHKTSKMMFLKTHDLSATWSYSHVEISSGVGYDTNVVDEADHSRLGLPNNKILKPKVKYKKYFCFKIPTEILDVNCKHQIPQHLGLPPSFGLNRSRKENAAIQCNDVLGYGHNGMRGSAVLCPDLATYDSNVLHGLKKHAKSEPKSFKNDGSSINYSVNCRLVMKNEVTKEPYVLNDTAYSVRIVPNTLVSNNKYKYSEGKASIVSISILKKKLLHLNLNASNRTEHLETLLQKLEHWESDSTFSKDDFSNHTQDILEKKQQQELRKAEVSWRDLDLQRDSFATLKKSSEEDKANFGCVDYKNQFKTVLSYDLGYKKKKSSSFEMLNNLFASTNSLELPNESLSKGKILIETALNKDLKALPYHRTSTIEQYNSFDKKNNVNKKIWTSEVYSQLPSNRSEYLLENLSLKFSLNANSLTDAPKLKNVVAFLNSYTCYTEKEIPFVLDANCIIKEGQFLKQLSDNSKSYLKRISDLKEKYTKYEDRLQSLAEKFGVDKSQIKFESFLNKTLVSDLESLSQLEVEQFEMRNIFERTDVSKASWKTVDKHLEFIIDLNLKYRKNLLLCVLPTFESCLISRFYHLQIECEFDTGDTAILKIPVDVKYF